MPEDDERGLYPKYDVCRTNDGSPVSDFCFVLKPEMDPAAREALRAYAMATPNLRLQTELIVWLQRFEEANGCSIDGGAEGHGSAGRGGSG